jgi:hypothetical protein
MLSVSMHKIPNYKSRSIESLKSRSINPSSDNSITSMLKIPNAKSRNLSYSESSKCIFPELSEQRERDKRNWRRDLSQPLYHWTDDVDYVDSFDADKLSASISYPESLCVSNKHQNKPDYSRALKRNTLSISNRSNDCLAMDTPFKDRAVETDHGLSNLMEILTTFSKFRQVIDIITQEPPNRSRGFLHIQLLCIKNQRCRHI